MDKKFKCKIYGRSNDLVYYEIYEGSKLIKDDKISINTPLIFSNSQGPLFIINMDFNNGWQSTIKLLEKCEEITLKDFFDINLSNCIGVYSPYWTISSSEKFAIVGIYEDDLSKAIDSLERYLRDREETTKKIIDILKKNNLLKT